MGKVLLVLVLLVGLAVGALWLRYETVSPCGVLHVQLHDLAEDKAQEGAGLLGGEAGALVGVLSGSLGDAVGARLVKHMSPYQCARGVVRVWMGDPPVQPGDVDVHLDLDLD